MNIKEKQVIVYYLKNIISNDVFSDDIDIFYHNLGRYSKELFGFDFRDIDDIIKSAKISRSEFLHNVIFSKADWIIYIKDKAMFEEKAIRKRARPDKKTSNDTWVWGEDREDDED